MRTTIIDLSTKVFKILETPFLWKKTGTELVPPLLRNKTTGIILAPDF
jgi:hypothetical protein